MLGKLMKYELKATWKLLIPANLFMVLMSILAYMTVQLSFFDSDNYVVVMTGIIVIMTYILSMFVIAVGTMIYLIYRFYKSVYGDEGYLLHTLPVDKHNIIIAKAVISALWVSLSSILMYLSIILIMSTRLNILKTMRRSFETYMELVDSGRQVGGFTVFMTLITLFIALLARILKITACISLGQLSSNHKVLSAFGFYYGIYFVQRFFTFIYYMILMLVAETSDERYQLSFLTLGTSWEFTLISSLIYCVVFYVLTWYIMDKKLNLE